MKHSFAPIEAALEALKDGRMIILMDDESRENEGDIVIAAEYATAEKINFMTRYARGLICLAMDGFYIDKLNLPMMTNQNRSMYNTAFTVSIEAAQGVTTGISAFDRAHTIAVAIDDKSRPCDVITPGHVFPLRAQPGGVLKRTGQTEGSVDLAKLAGLKAAAVICEIINEDGSMSRLPNLLQFANSHNLLLVRIKDLIEYRIRHQQLIKEAAKTNIPLLNFGLFEMTVFHNQLDCAEHFALKNIKITPSHNPLVRIHSECITGDVFGSCKCDCGAQLQQSMQLIGEQGGILIYLRQEGRGIGLANKLKAYSLQEQGYDTVEANLKLGLPADNRDYAIAYQILKYFNINSLRLLTNNPHKLNAIEKYGLNITQRIPLDVYPTEENRHYLKTKQNKLGHLLALD